MCAVALAPRGSETGRCLSVAHYVTGMGPMDGATAAGSRSCCLSSWGSPRANGPAPAPSAMVLAGRKHDERVEMLRYRQIVPLPPTKDTVEGE